MADLSQLSDEQLGVYREMLAQKQGGGTPTPQGPSVGQRALSNLPSSAANFVSSLNPLEGPKPTKDAGGTYRFPPIDPIGEITAPFRKLGSIISNLQEEFANDPVGTIATPAAMAYGGYKGLRSEPVTATARGALEGAKAVPLSKTGAAVGTLAGQLSGVPHGYALGAAIGGGYPKVAGALRGGLQGFRSATTSPPVIPTGRVVPSVEVPPPQEFSGTPGSLISGRRPGSIANQVPATPPPPAVFGDPEGFSKLPPSVQEAILRGGSQSQPSIKTPAAPRSAEHYGLTLEPPKAVSPAPTATPSAASVNDPAHNGGTTKGFSPSRAARQQAPQPASSEDLLPAGVEPKPKGPLSTAAKRAAAEAHRKGTT